jgi:hypothetical protein
MEVRIDLKSWRVKRDDETKSPKICGEYAIMSGAMEIACKSFNDGYGCLTVPISTQLMLEAEQLTEKIAKEIKKNLTGVEDK